MRLGGDDRVRPRHNDAPEGFPFKFSQLSGIVLAMVVVCFVISSIGSVEITEYALKSSWITRKVERETFGSGRYLIPFNAFIKFPAVVRTIQFSDSSTQTDLAVHEQGNPILKSRTSDGLDVSIELSFQYKLKKEQVHDLYLTMGSNLDFHQTFTRIAIDRLTEVATRYSANQFFVNRTVIGHAMEAILKDVFQARLFSDIFSFQLRTVMLPEAFEKAIQDTEVKKQDVRVAEAEQKSNKVAFETELIQAQRRVQVKSNGADAIAKSVMLANAAEIEQFNATQRLQADSYKNVKTALGSEETSLLLYMQNRALRDHPSDKTTLALNLPVVQGNSLQ